MEVILYGGFFRLSVRVHSISPPWAERSFRGAPQFLLGLDLSTHGTQCYTAVCTSCRNHGVARLQVDINVTVDILTTITICFATSMRLR